MANRKKSKGGILAAMPVMRAEGIIRNLPYIFFLAFLGFIMIMNGRYAENNVREIQTLQKEIQKLNWEYLALKSDLMQKSMESEVAKEAKNRNLGLNELEVRPKKIVVEKGKYK